VRRTAVGVDLDRAALEWGLSHNVHSQDLGHRMGLFHGDVLSPCSSAKRVLEPGTERDVELGAAQELCSASQGVDHQQNGEDSGKESGAVESLSIATGAVPEPTGVDMRPSTQAIEHEANAEGLPPDMKAESPHGHGEGSGTSQEPLGPAGAISPVDQESSFTDVAELSPGDELHDRACSVVCALNFSVCLLHTAKDVARYFKGVRAAFKDAGGIFVMDLLGGPNAETPLNVIRRNEVTRAEYGWEQLGVDPVTRLQHTYLSLRHRPTRQTVRRAFHYHWRLWTVPELCDMLLAAGFDDVKVWLRPMADEQGEDAEEGGQTPVCILGEEPSEAPSSPGILGFLEYKPGIDMTLFQKGWTAYLVGVVRPKGGEGPW
jgi:hypothetical protein